MFPREWVINNIVNDIAVDDLVSQGDRTSVAMALTYFSGNTPV